MIFVYLGILMLAPGAFGKDISWIPDQVDLHPSSRADWNQPRFGITWHGSTLYAALGAPITLASGGSHLTWNLTLEGLAHLQLAREGAFFPLQTVDGAGECL